MKKIFKHLLYLFIISCALCIVNCAMEGSLESLRPSGNDNGNGTEEDVYYTVSFESNGGSGVESQTVSPGGKITEPLITKTGATFGGWYRDTERTIPWFFDTDTVNSAVILYAKWNEYGKFTVNFSAVEGTPSWSNIEVDYGSTLTEPLHITRTGHTVEWYKDAELTTVWDFESDTIIGNTMIYAKWWPILYTVTFYEWDNNTYTTPGTNTASVLHGNTITINETTHPPVAPTTSLTYTVFDGWFTAPTSGTLWSGSTPVYRPFNLYAIWSEPTVQSLVITVTVSIPSNAANASTDIVLVEDIDNLNAGTGGILVIDIINYLDFAYINWYHNNVSIDTPISSDGGKYTIDPTTSTLTIDFNEFTLAELINGNQIFTAVGDEDTLNDRTNFIIVSFILP